MMMKQLFLTLLCVLLAVVVVRADVPDTITVHGQLLDDTGTPLTGNRDYEITFYDAEVDGTPLGTTFTGTTELSLEGIFDIPLVLSEEAKVVAELWYAIAVDSDTVANGIDGNDLFPNRIKVESVPFALQAETVASIPLLEGVTTPVQEQLDAKADTDNVYSKAEVDTSQDAQDTEIAAKANVIDVYTQAEIDATQAAQDTEIVLKANAADVYTQIEIDDSQALQDVAIAEKANTADVYSKAEVDASQASQDTEITLKANAADIYTKTEVDAFQTTQDTEIALKANAADVYTQSEIDISQSTQDDAIALKADLASVYTQSEIDTAQAAQDVLIAQKADAADVYTQTEIDTAQAAQDTAIASKADAADVYTKTEVDASQASQDTEIALKADAADLSAHTADTSNPHNVTAAQVELANVDNTADLDKPVSTATQAALDAKADDSVLTVHTSDTDNPHVVTASQVGAIPAMGTAYVVVETTDAPVTNGTNLKTAYATAKTLTPNGAVLSTTNRAVVIVPPGKYNLGGSVLTLDSDFVDIEGLSNDRTKQYIFRSGGNVLRQTAADVRIENLLLHYTGTAYNNAYSPNVTWNDGTDHTGSPPETTIRNCEFRVDGTILESMRSSVEYAGTYEDCMANGWYAFGGDSGGTASGNFINCTGSDSAFGGGGGTANGKFTNCTGGARAFGGDSGGTASGNFVNCKGGARSFAGFGTASGKFTNCTGAAISFGGSSWGNASGTFKYCSSGDNAFGGAGGTANGGEFFHCVGGSDSFTTGGAPTILYCVRDGAVYP